MNNWLDIMPMVEKDLTEQGIDLDPKRLPEIMAKSITKETLDNKGICMIGGVGSGKTKRMKFLANAVNITMMDAREMCAVWCDMQGNEASFAEYIKADNLKYSVVPTCYHDLIIDDLGSENETYNSYGTAVDVMRDIIIPLRYKQFPRWRTFFTTNLSKTFLKERYGDRVFSRLEEMCVFFPLSHTDRRIKNG